MTTPPRRSCWDGNYIRDLADYQRARWDLSSSLKRDVIRSEGSLSFAMNSWLRRFWSARIVLTPLSLALRCLTKGPLVATFLHAFSRPQSAQEQA